MVGTDYETQNVSMKREEKHRNLEAAILRDLSKRTPYNCPNWTEEDWDSEDAELIKEWQWTDSFQLAICSSI